MMRTLISMISLMVVLGLGAAASAATITVDTDKKFYFPGESITVTTTTTVSGAEGTFLAIFLELLWNDAQINGVPCPADLGVPLTFGGLFGLVRGQRHDG